jgi:hypothetical protein
MPVILATQEAERRTAVQSQPWANNQRDPISKKTHHKKRASDVPQGVDPEFKHQY